MITFGEKLARIRVDFHPGWSTLSRSRRLVGVAQLVRASDCDSECRGFESRHSPHFSFLTPIAAQKGTAYEKKR